MVMVTLPARRGVDIDGDRRGAGIDRADDRRIGETAREVAVPLHAEGGFGNRSRGAVEDEGEAAGGGAGDGGQDGWIVVHGRVAAEDPFEAVVDAVVVVVEIEGGIGTRQAVGGGGPGVIGAETLGPLVTVRVPVPVISGISMPLPGLPTPRKLRGSSARHSPRVP